MKYMTRKEFQEEGFLQEANRQFFHPLGLALAVENEGELDEENYFRVQVWDERDDPEGWFFLRQEISAEKAERVRALRKSKLEERTRVLNGVNWTGIQPLDTDITEPDHDEHIPGAHYG